MEMQSSRSESAPLAPMAVGPDEAARITGHSRSAIYNSIAAGDLSSFKAGKRRLILVRELEIWINRLARENSK
jgi:excisionase family DNA binding protein